MDSSRRRLCSHQHRRTLSPANPAPVTSQLPRSTQPLTPISKPLPPTAKAFHSLPPMPRIYQSVPFPPGPPFRPADRLRLKRPLPHPFPLGPPPAVPSHTTEIAQAPSYTPSFPSSPSEEAKAPSNSATCPTPPSDEGKTYTRVLGTHPSVRG